MWSMKVSLKKYALQPIWFFVSFTAIAIGSIRVTFFIAYLNIFGPMRWLRISAYTGAFFSAIYHVTISIVILTPTTPAPGRTWFSAMTTVEYQHFLGLLVPSHTIGFALDLCILVLPLIAVSKLQMPVRKKIGVSLIFMTGIA